MIKKDILKYAGIINEAAKIFGNKQKNNRSSKININGNDYYIYNNYKNKIVSNDSNYLIKLNQLNKYFDESKYNNIISNFVKLKKWELSDIINTLNKIKEFNENQEINKAKKGINQGITLKEIPGTNYLGEIDGRIIREILNYKASCALGSRSYCISNNPEYYRIYKERGAFIIFADKIKKEMINMI